MKKRAVAAILLLLVFAVVLQFFEEKSSIGILRKSGFLESDKASPQAKSRPSNTPRPPPFPAGQTIPFVYVGLNYQMGGGASIKVLPYLCEKNDRIVILTNVEQSTPAAELGPCVEEMRISGASYRNSTSEMPWWPKRGAVFPHNQKVFFDRWYVMRDWMRVSNTSWVFAMDSDCIVTENVTDIARRYSAKLSQHAAWVCREPPRSTFAFALLSLDFLEDITRFWNELFRGDPALYWTDKEGLANDMVALGHYIHMSEGGGLSHQCWANTFNGTLERHPGSCSSSYGFRAVLGRLRKDGITAKFTVGSLQVNQHGQSDIAPELGWIDKNYQHDPTSFFEMRNGQKLLRFVEGQPHLALKNDTWARQWGYILENELESCVGHHLSHIHGRLSCRCNNFCCNECKPDPNVTRRRRLKQKPVQSINS